MHDRSTTEYALEEVRSAPEALRASVFVAEALLAAARAGRERPSAADLAGARATAEMGPGHGVTRSGDPMVLLRDGPGDGRAVAVLNCFFSLGMVSRLQSLPEENRRGLVHDLVRHVDHLLAHSLYSPYEFLPFIAPAKLGLAVWDRLVETLIEEVNGSGASPSAAALVRADSLRHLPAEVRGAYLRRILAGCIDPDAGLLYASLLLSMDEHQSVGSAPEQRALPPARPTPALPPGRPAPMAPPLRLHGVVAAEPAAPLRGAPDPGPTSLWVRGLMLLTGLLVVRELARVLVRVLGFRFEISWEVERGALLFRQALTWWGRGLWHRQWVWPAQSVTCRAQGPDQSRIRMLIGVTALAVLAAFAVPLLVPGFSPAARDLVFVAGAVVLAGVLLDLLQSPGAVRRRGRLLAVFTVPGRTFAMIVPTAHDLERFLVAAQRAGLAGLSLLVAAPGDDLDPPPSADSGSRPPELDG